jgi:hypothetical protein
MTLFLGVLGLAHTALIASFYIFSPAQSYAPLTVPSMSTMFEYGVEVQQRLNGSLLTKPCDSERVYIYSQGADHVINSAQYFAQGLCYSNFIHSPKQEIITRSKPPFGNLEVSVPLFVLHDIPVISNSELNESALFSNVKGNKFKHKLYSEISTELNMILNNQTANYTRMNSKDFPMNKVRVFSYFCDVDRLTEYAQDLIYKFAEISSGSFITIHVEDTGVELYIDDQLYKAMNLSDFIQHLNKK